MLRKLTLLALAIFVLRANAETGACVVQPRRVTLSELLARGETNTAYTVDGYVVSTVGSTWVVFRDGTRGIFAADESGLCRQPGLHVRATIVRRTGSPQSGNPPVYEAITAIEPLGIERSVADPIPISPSDVIHADACDCHRVTVRGTVTKIIHDELDPRWKILFVEADGARAIVQITLTEANRPFPSDAELTDAEIDATGVLFMTASAGRRHLGPHVANYDGHAVRIIRPAPKDPFSDSPAVTHLSAVPRKSRISHRQHTAGRVIATFGSSSAILLRKDGRRIRVRLAEDAVLPPVGTTVDVAGFVRSNIFFPYIDNALWRRNGTARIPEDGPCEDVSPRSLLFDRNGRREIKQEYDGRCIRIQGRLTDVLPISDGRHRLVLNADDIILNIETPPLAPPPIGSTVSVVGICLLLDSSDGYDDFVRLNGFSLVLRAPSDLTVLSSPPWWTVRRILILLGIVTTVLFAAFVWIILLRRLAERRGNQLAQTEIAAARSELKRAERTRLAVELHDSISQNLTSTVLQLDASQNARASDPAAAERHLQAAHRILQGCRAELRRCIWDLHSSILDLADFEEAIRISLRPVAHAIHLTIRAHVPRERLSDNVAHAVIRILRELVANAIRHGRANNIRVAGDISSGPLKFSVSDDGCGFPPGTPPGPEDGHFGLMGIRERMREMGGTLQIEGLSPTGTKITFVIPSPDGTETQTSPT